LIDTHCHVHDRKFDADRDEVVARARAAGVTKMLTVGESIDDSRSAISTAQRYDISAAAGIHPHEAKHAPSDVAAELRPLLEERGVVAIGETGLDYYYLLSPRDVQAAVLRAQLRVARETTLPLVFHQRDAFDDFVAILREEWTPQMRGVVHCFTGTAAQARTYVEEFGLYLGIGGVLTFPNASSLRDAVVDLGIGNLVLETDCPYLAPVPMRGRRNEPAFVTYTGAELAKVLGLTLDTLAARTDENARNLFAI
jgi:TatD DNase family protein